MDAGGMAVAIAQAVAVSMQQAWLFEHPSPDCADHDAGRMRALVALVDRQGRAEDHDAMRTHLLHCPRCRLIYARVRRIEPPLAG